MFSCHDADKYGYSGDFWLSQCASKKLDYFSMGRVMSRRVQLSLIAYYSGFPKETPELKFRLRFFFPFSVQPQFAIFLINAHARRFY